MQHLGTTYVSLVCCVAFMMMMGAALQGCINDEISTCEHGSKGDCEKDNDCYWSECDSADGECFNHYNSEVDTVCSCPDCNWSEHRDALNGLGCFPDADSNHTACLIDGCSCKECQTVCAAGRAYITNAGALTAQLLPIPSNSSNEFLRCESDWSKWPKLEGSAVTLRDSEQPAELRNEIAQFYADVGLAEHVSVASFSRVVLELMEEGAPAGLVDRTLAAGREEVKHTQMALALARSWSENPFTVSGIKGLREQHSQDLVDFARHTVMEACAGETPAVLRAVMARHFARDQRVIAYLDVVQVEERRHAELAWATLWWAMARPSDADVRDAVRSTVVAAFASTVASLEAEQREAKQVDSDEKRIASLLAVGILSPELNARVARTASWLVERLHSMLMQEVFGQNGLEHFESLVHQHFGDAIGMLVSAVSNDKANTQTQKTDLTM